MLLTNPGTAFRQPTNAGMQTRGGDGVLVGIPRVVRDPGLTPGIELDGELHLDDEVLLAAGFFISPASRAAGASTPRSARPFLAVRAPTQGRRRKRSRRTSPTPAPAWR